MMYTYIFEYLDEKDFRKKESSVKRYNMFTFKKLIYNYSKLRKGTFLGKVVGENKKTKTVTYELKLPTEEIFKKIYGAITLHYTVYTEKGIILLTNITPEGILGEVSVAESSIYKGAKISKTNLEKDGFQINLLNMLEK